MRPRPRWSPVILILMISFLSFCSTFGWMTRSVGNVWWEGRRGGTYHRHPKCSVLPSMPAIATQQRPWVSRSVALSLSLTRVSRVSSISSVSSISRVSSISSVSSVYRVSSVSRAPTTAVSSVSTTALTDHDPSFVHHHVQEEEGIHPHETPPTTLQDIVQQVLLDKQRILGTAAVTELNAAELIQLGAVWYLPAHRAAYDKPRRVAYDPLLVQGPQQRSSASGGALMSRTTDTMTATTALSSHGLVRLQPGDYLRIHFYPRRFPAATSVDWTQHYQEGGPLVAVQEHYCIVDKPPGCPVHKTVDNALENVASALQTYFDYIGSPQRLDQNTSGLLVVATSKPFAHYFANLLRHKTSTQLQVSNHGNNTRNSTNSNPDIPDNSGQEQSPQPLQPATESVHKGYRCLVCLQPPRNTAMPWSVQSAWQQLQQLVQDNTTIRHFLEPSIRAPKVFVDRIPEDVPDKDSWQECLMRLVRVSEPLALVGGSAAAQDLQQTLRVPSHCLAVVECECELLTGRTHQIRGQLSTLGYPLVGDAPYGGADPTDYDAMLALQCYRLEFVAPRAIVTDSGDVKLVRSHEWKTYELDRAWWSPHVEAYRQATSQSSDQEATTGAMDVGLIERAPPPPMLSDRPARPDLLPSPVQISPGKNKYIMIRATHPNDDEVRWFVKSATPAECGGPYHGNVAQDLREWIEAAGYTVKVVGGGRIDYNTESKQAVVYGFSYGFGLAPGQHERAAAMINQHMDGVVATHDNTEGLY